MPPSGWTQIPRYLEYTLWLSLCRLSNPKGALQVLGYLNAKASEVDFDTKSFSAYVGSKIFYQKINLDIQSQEEQRQLVSISFSSRLRRNYFLRPSFEVGSDIMNHFIYLVVLNIEQVERTVQPEKHTSKRKTKSQNKEAETLPS